MLSSHFSSIKAVILELLKELVTLGEVYLRFIGVGKLVENLSHLANFIGANY